MTPFEIPLSPTPQRFTIELNSVTYQLTFKWCVPAACWLMDIADQNQNPLASGLPVITGENILQQFAYLEIGGAIVAQTDSDSDAVPTFENLGETGRVYFVLP